MFFTLLLIVQFIVAALMVLVILMQKSEGGGLTSGGSPSGLAASDIAWPKAGVVRRQGGRLSARSGRLARHRRAAPLRTAEESATASRSPRGARE